MAVLLLQPFRLDRPALAQRYGGAGESLEWHDHVIGSPPFAPEGFSGAVRVGDEAGAPVEGAISRSGLAPRPPYQMRHTYASLSLAAGADIYWVSKQMGHKDISVTLKHYARFARGSAVDERNRRLLNDFGRAGSEGASEVRHAEVLPEPPRT